jgi:hypothetical protein
MAVMMRVREMTWIRMREMMMLMVIVMMGQRRVMLATQTWRVL